MKATQIIAAAAVAAVLGSAGVSIAGATSGGASQPIASVVAPTATTSTAARAPRARTRARAGLVLAAKTIGIAPKDLLAQLKAGKSIADVATAHHVDPNTVITALADAAKTKFGNDITTRITNLVNHKGLPNADQARARTRKAVRGAVAVAAKTIGIQPQELGSELRAGKSVADVATAHHVGVQTVIDALVNVAKTKITVAKNAGRISAAQAGKLEANLTTRITKLVNRTFGTHAAA